MKVKPRVLVTGAAGFIGSHLVERLVNEGFSVRAMVHYNFRNSWGWLDTLSHDIKNEIDVFAGDITDPFSVMKAVDGCSVVYHLAALIAIPYSYVAPASYVNTNISGTLNVLEAAKALNIDRVIHTSTSEVYGSAQYSPMDESHPIVGQSPYSASKIAADKLAESYSLSFGIPVATVRPFNTFGPRQSARAVIPTVIAQALSDTPRVELGSLHPVRDLNYVEDTVAGFLACGTEDIAIGKVLNFGRGEGVSIGELAKMILELCGSSAEIVSSNDRVRPTASEVQALICDSGQAKQLLNWAPRYTLQSGLKKTVDWMKENLHLYKSHLYNI